MLRPRLKREVLPWLAVLLVALSPRMSYAADSLPVPWNGMDIGGPSPAGTAREEGGVFTLTGGGALAGTRDQFHFVYQYLVGDCVLVARVSAGADPGVSVGIMARQALSSDSDFVAVLLTPGHGAVSLSRSPYAPKTAAGGVAAASPGWLKLVKRGLAVRSYLAPDQSGRPGAWKQVGGVQPIPSGLIYVGLCRTGQAQGGAATFDHVSLMTGAVPALEDGLYTVSPSGAPNMALAITPDGGVHLALSDGSAGRTWRIANKGGFYSIQPASDPSLALSVPGAKSASGSPVAVTTDRGQDTQRWSIVPGREGLYSLLPQFDTHIGLDDFGGDGTPSAVIDIWNYDSADPHLQWAITPAP